MKKCKVCGLEKEIERFKPVKTGNVIYRSGQCKDCRNKKLRKGGPNLGQFKKGNKPIHTTFIKGFTPWNKGMKLGKGRNSKENYEWKEKVKERDGYKCVKCGVDKGLTCHHIKPWRKHPELRFDPCNGMTLCKICHGKEEGPLNANNGINTQFKKGHKLSPESIEKMKEIKRLRKKYGDKQ